MATWKLTLAKPDRYGRKQVRTVNLAIDIRDFKDKAGFVWLLMAANPDLSIRNLQEVLEAVDEKHMRPLGWLSRRRWLFHGTGTSHGKGNRDGLDGRAYRIMRENRGVSSRKMSRILLAAGIRRSRDWVLKHYPLI